MITAIRQSKVRLPQLSIKNLDKSKERSNKPTIRSNNIMYDSSNSPPKTRTDNISRGSLSTPLQYCRYSCYNMCRVDSSFNDQEIFSAQQKSVPRSDNNNNQGEQLEKLSQRLKNMTNHKKKLNGSISNQQPKKTEPYITKQPRSPKIRHFKTEDRVEELNQIQKQQIQDKIKEIYEQVQNMIKSHKGYVRQAEKKNVFIQLVQLKKEFKLLNQDYNEFYQNNTNSLKIDFEIVDRIEELKKLFESGKPVKRNGVSIFDGLDISFVMQTEGDEKSNQNQIQEISEKDQEQSQDQMEQFTDQMTDCSPSNSTFRRRMTNLIKQRSSKQMAIQPIQIQNINQTQQQQGIRRKSSSNSLTSPLTPESSARTSLKNKITPQQILQQRLNLPQTPPKVKEKQFQEDQNEVLKKEIQKRQSKMLSRKTIQETQQNSSKNSKKQTKRNSLAEVTENSETEIKLSKIQSRRNSINKQEEQPIIESILNEVLENNTINEVQQTQLQQQKEQKVKPQKQITQFQIDKCIKKVIQELSNCDQIYDEGILNKNRKNKHKTEWFQDIDSILQNYNQFF